MKRWHILFGGSFLVALSVASACGDSASDAGGSGGSAGVTVTGGSGSKAASGATASTKAATTGANNTSAAPASGSTGAGNACGMMATYGECVACFCEANAAGCESYFAFEDEACLCGMGTPCATDCSATYCTSGTFDGACETCYNALPETDMCFETAYTSCQADATCNAYLVAEEAACGALPE